MQITLEIKADHASDVLKVLKSMKGVQIKSIDQASDEYLMELKNAFIQTEQAEQGKIKLKSFDELINDL